MSQFIQNPILRGFNPDPSIVRVGDDYYIATSTFEWFPGVQIHHSRDLRHWQLLGQVLNRQSQLDMRGAPDSCGVWAPCLSYCEGIFYVVYSNVASFDGGWKDTPNYVVTSSSIHGPWSEPTFLTSRGFDASLFHDQNGKKWVSNMLVDHRQGKFFGGIQLQEFDVAAGCLVGDVHKIFVGTELGCTEGPHIFQKKGWYYLLMAEGGTEYGHAVSLARAKNITGPYELHPHNPIFSASECPQETLQKTGHADLVETQNGEWYAVYLTGRPLTERGRCTLGRETVIEQVEWRDDDWLYSAMNSTAMNSKTTRMLVPAPDLPEHKCQPLPALEDFNSPDLSPHWQSLRVPVNDTWLSLQERPGFLRLRGRESLSSTRDQSLLARRVQSFHIEASCALDFQPKNFQQMAGLVCYYNTGLYFYLYLSANEEKTARELRLLVCDNFCNSEPLPLPVEIPMTGEVFLKVEWLRESVQFFYALKNENAAWIKIGPVLDGSLLSDEHVREMCERYRPAFTGSFVGVCCQDLSGMKCPVDIDWFLYQELSVI
jgi:xylan 1,4-beta-xylosidase